MLAQSDGGAAMFDVSSTPWGPGRRSSGEVFRSTAAALDEGVLRWSWPQFSLGVGAQYFSRGELRDGSDFSRAAPDLSVGFDQRARLTVRGSAFERVGVLVELQDVRGWGSAANTALHQGFVDVRATSFLDVRVGRQELSYGEERLIGSLDWAQTARAFDGVFTRVTASKHVTIDGFGMLLRAGGWLTPTAGGAPFQNSGSYFTGVYARARFGVSGIDGYLLGLLEDPGTAASGWRPDNNRLTLGARAFTTLARLTVVAEGAFQTGLAGHAVVQAGAFAAKATWVLSAPTAPYLAAELSAASGDSTPGDSVVSTFHQLFPTGHAHLGFVDLMAWQNVIAVRGTVGFRPGGAHVWLDVHHFSAWAPQDAWYAANGSVFVAADALRTTSNRGTELDLSGTVPVIANLSVAGGVGVFLPEPITGKGTNPAAWGFVSLRAQL